MLHQLIYILTLYLVLVNCFENPYCQLSCIQNGQVLEHTVCERQNQKCGPDPRCGSDFKSVKLNDALRQHILNLHNKLRNNVASGNEPRGQQPAASNMEILSYNLELEFIAKCWANACNGQPLVHDKCRKTETYNVGQNLAYFNSTSANNLSIKKMITTMIMLWYDEVATFRREWIKSTQNRGTNVVGHYTQLVWANTNEIGCGLTYYTTVDNYTNKKWHTYLLVCNYGPSGNYIGAPVYLEGRPCTACKNKYCNKQYTSLCEGSDNTSNKKFNPIFEI